MPSSPLSYPFDANLTTVVAASVVVAAVVGAKVALNIKSSSKDKADDSVFAEPPPNATFVTLAGSGHKIRYTDTGTTDKGTPTVTLVLVHGFGGCLETWNSLIPILQQH